MKRIFIIYSLTVCLMISLMPFAQTENIEIDPKQLYILGDEWIGEDESKVCNTIKERGYAEDFTIPVIDGHMFYNHHASLSHIILGYDYNSKKVNSVGFSFKANPDIFLDIYETIDTSIGSPNYSTTDITWETDKVTYSLTASFLEQSDTPISIMEIQLGKRDFVLYINQNNNANTSKTDNKSSKIISAPTATPKPIVSKISILSATVNRNRYGTYELYVSFKNNESNNVDRIDFRVKCFDAYGNQSKAYNYYDMTELCYDLTIRTNGISDRDLYWRLSGYNDVKTVEIAVIKYHTTDGRTVEIPDYDLKWYKF